MPPLEPEVEDLLRHWLRFIVPLRLGNDPNESAFTALKETLITCAKRWKGQTTIPKVAANTLVDMFSAVMNTADSRSGERRAELHGIAAEIYDLVAECVAIPEYQQEIERHMV